MLCRGTQFHSILPVVSDITFSQQKVAKPSTWGISAVVAFNIVQADSVSDVIMCCTTNELVVSAYKREKLLMLILILIRSNRQFCCFYKIGDMIVN